MSYETLIFKKNAGIAYISINRPEKLNVLSRAVLDELRQCFESVRDDEEVRAVILSGEGERAFAAGADIREISTLDAASGREAARRGQETFDLIENLGKPVIAAIRGYALGGGCELAMACTFRIAAKTARLGQPEVKIGVIPGYGGTQRLPRIVGKARALEMILSGEAIAAQQAHRIGLVDCLVPEEEVIGAAEAMAHKIMANAPLAVSLALQAVNFGTTTGKQEGMLFEAALFGVCCGTQDMKEGTRAFLEKRPATFSGK